MMAATDYEDVWRDVWFYKMHPYMMPFVGKNYESLVHGKLLIVAESHYMPEKSTIHHNAVDWYDKPLLSELEELYCNTRITRDNKSALTKNIRGCINAVYNQGEGWEEVAFVNYFLRPADNREGKKKSENIRTLWGKYGGESLDREQSALCFKTVLERIKPDDTVFLSALAWECAMHDFPKYNGGMHMNNVIRFVHPSCSWWNRRTSRTNGLTNRESFIAYLKQKWLAS